MLALDLYESEVHVRGCGFHSSLATDVTNVFRSRVEYCPLCAALELQERQLAADDRKARGKVKDGEVKPLPSDGRRIYTRQLDPSEVEQAASAGPPAAASRRTRLWRR